MLFGKRIGLVGSSPHTWRIQGNQVIMGEKLRIISTYVENTGERTWLKTWEKDHLHIRGEYSDGFTGNSTVLGSSPHTWRIPAAV